MRVPWTVEEPPADLFIRKELDCGIRNNSDAVGAIALEHALDALFAVHVFTTLQSQLFMVSYGRQTAQ